MAHPFLSYPVVAFMMIWWLFRGVAGAAPPNPDPLQSSAEFGAAEATAKIATKAGFVDIVWIKLGMPVKEATAALQAHNASFKIRPITLAV